MSELLGGFEARGMTGAHKRSVREDTGAICEAMCRVAAEGRELSSGSRRNGHLILPTALTAHFECSFPHADHNDGIQNFQEQMIYSNSLARKRPRR